MSRGYQSLSLDGEELKLRMKEAKSIDEYKRYQAVHLRVNEGMEVSVISRVIPNLIINHTDSSKSRGRG